MFSSLCLHEDIIILLTKIDIYIRDLRIDEFLLVNGRLGE